MQWQQGQTLKPLSGLSFQVSRQHRLQQTTQDELTEIQLLQKHNQMEEGKGEREKEGRQVDIINSSASAVDRTSPLQCKAPLLFLLGQVPHGLVLTGIL